MLLTYLRTTLLSQVVLDESTLDIAAATTVQDMVGLSTLIMHPRHLVSICSVCSAFVLRILFFLRGESQLCDETSR